MPAYNNIVQDCGQRLAFSDLSNSVQPIWYSSRRREFHDHTRKPSIRAELIRDGIPTVYILSTRQLIEFIRGSVNITLDLHMQLSHATRCCGWAINVQLASLLRGLTYLIKRQDLSQIWQCSRHTPAIWAGFRREFSDTPLLGGHIIVRSLFDCFWLKETGEAIIFCLRFPSSVTEPRNWSSSCVAAEIWPHSSGKLATCQPTVELLAMLSWGDEVSSSVD